MITRNKQLNEEALKQYKNEGEQSDDDELEEKTAREREEAELAQAIEMSEALEVKIC